MFKKLRQWVLASLLVMLCLVSAGAALAQDGAIEPLPVPQTSEIILLVALVAAMIMLGLFGMWLYRAVKVAHDGLPPWAKDVFTKNFELIEQQYNRLDKLIEQKVSSSPNKLDNEIAEIVDRQVRAMLENLRPGQIQGPPNG